MSDLSVKNLPDLPPTIDLMTAAKILGIGRTKAYLLAKADQFPVQIIKIGDLYRVSTPDLIRLLHAGKPNEDAVPRHRY